MQRALLSALVVAASLAGCALPEPAAAPRSASGDIPLHARLWMQQTSSQSSFVDFAVRLSEPAYISVFELSPGRGATLIYPARFQGQTLHHTGTNSLAGFHARLGRDAYVGVAPMFPQPTYYLLIASREPLQIDHLMSSPYALRREMGLARFAGFQASSLMDDIVDIVVPGTVSDAGWAYDVHVVWPQRVSERRARSLDRLVPMTCGDGRVIHVPLWWTYNHAEHFNTLCPDYQPPAPSDTTGVPTDTTSAPTDRRPIPGREAAPGTTTAERGEEARPRRQARDEIDRENRWRDEEPGRPLREARPDRAPRSGADRSAREPRRGTEAPMPRRTRDEATDQRSEPREPRPAPPAREPRAEPTQPRPVSPSPAAEPRPAPETQPRS
jgi:hypothetical protein